LSFPSIKVLLELAFEPALLDQMGGQLSTKDAAADPQKEMAEAPEAASKTFDLLLDVELPVSVSFGRAQVALKDLIKLTTGSIVELNRSITEPVEVIVNNCVIARGEVVVVEGNFGVRIQQVVSRQERLRTLV
jgi:flagellar motor switch protein FliN/FliY